MPIECTCLECGIKFYVEPYRIKNGGGKFHNRECYGKWNSKYKSGKNHPSWKGGDIEIICSQCGIKFLRKKSLIKQDLNFHNKICHDKWMSENNCGENNHMFGKHLSQEACNKIGNANRGRIVSFETKRKISDAGKGRTHSQESIIKMRGAHKGKTFSVETRKKIGDANRGRIPSIESRKKMGISQKLRTPDSEETRIKKSIANKGKTLSEESRKKIGDANRGRLVSLETRIKISVAGKGRLKSENHRKKIGESQKGKIISMESRKKIGDANRGRTRTIESCKKQSATIKGTGNHMFGKEHTYETRARILEDRIGGFWYGNVRNDYTISQLIRSHIKSKNYTTSILDRDQYKDFYTKEPCKYPEVHHIIKLKDIVKKYNIKTLDEAIACEPLWDTNNGITLEKRNHAQWHRCHDKFEYTNKENIDKLYG